jgi:hypothetical protein
VLQFLEWIRCKTTIITIWTHFEAENLPILRFNDEVLKPNEIPMIKYESASLFLDDNEDEEWKKIMLVYDKW